MISPAKDLSKGRLVLTQPSPAGGPAGPSGRIAKMPFQDMSAKQKKKLGLPDLPALPEIPEVPQVPQVPKVPQLPQIPRGMKPGGAVAQERGAEAEKTGQEDAVAEDASPESGAASGRQRITHPEVQPEKDTLAKLIPDGAISPSAAASSFEIKQVVNLKATPEGIEIELQGKTGPVEKIVVPPGEPVTEIRDAKELKKGMRINASLVDAEGGAVAREITVF
jgi:hypothetical protein